MPCEGERKNNHVLCIVLLLTHTHISFASIPTQLLFVKNCTWQSLHLLMIKDHFVIHLTVQYLSCALAMMGNFNERWDRDFSLIQVSPVWRSVPRGSDAETLIILHTEQWPYSHTRTCRSVDPMVWRLEESQKAENRWLNSSALCINIFSHRQQDEKQRGKVHTMGIFVIKIQTCQPFSMKEKK